MKYKAAMNDSVPVMKPNIFILVNKFANEHPDNQCANGDQNDSEIRKEPQIAFNLRHLAQFSRQLRALLGKGFADGG
jgi:hypothetical protein